MTLIEKAQRLAHEAHDSIGQKRKYTGEPYWVHPDAVAATVAQVGGDENMVIAAYLHDVREDVFPLKPQYDAQWIWREFNDDVMDRVLDLTDVYTKVRYPKMNRAQRKALEHERLSIIPPRSQTIKLADMIDNTESIVAHDKDFARVYLREAMDTLGILSDGNPVLLQRLSMQLLAGFASLGLTIPMIGA